MYRLLLFQKWFLIFARNYSGTGIQAFWRRIRSLGLAMFILVAIQVGTTPAVASTLDQRKLLSAEPAAFPCGSGEFTQYGMNATGFTQEQEDIILQAVSAYANALGGAEQFKKILTTCNGISCKEIYFNPEGVGAYTNIRLKKRRSPN